MSNNLPLVSISCITYNHADYIRHCLDGFLMQKTSFLYEIVIHDDASADGTADIIREYEIKYPDIIKPIYQKENQYSKGIKISQTYNFPRVQGKYIAFCEGDDYWIDPNKLQMQVEFLENNPEYGMCCHNAYKYNGKSFKLFNKKHINFRDLKNIVLKWHIPTASIVLRKELLGQLMPSKKNYRQGDILIHMAAYHYGKIKYIDIPMCVYRTGVNGSATMNSIKDPIGFLNANLQMWNDFDRYYNNLYHSVIIRKIRYVKVQILKQLLIKRITILQKIRHIKGKLCGKK